MNIFGFNIHVSRASDAPALWREKTFSPEEWLAGEDLGGAMLSNAYEQSVWVYRAINVLAEQVANVPFLFSVGERGRENLVTSGPLHEFYAHPHPHLNRFQYWELRVIWLMLRGECVRVPVFENAGPGRPARLQRVVMLDPAQLQHIVEDHELIGWRYTGFGPRTPLAGQVFLPEEVWFERLPNPFDFWRGLAPLHVAAMAAATDFAAGAFMRGIIENNADTGMIVRTDKWLAKEQREQIIAALRDRKRRAGVADRPVLITGSAEILKPQLSSTDLQFLENRKFSRAEICAAFGVPEEIVTTTDHAKYDVMAGARLNFIENRVAPLCARLVAGEEAAVKSIDPRASGWFDLDSLPIMQEARRRRLEAARTGFEMGIPLNELNRVLDLGFRPLPWGDRGFVSGNLRDLGTDGKSPPAPAATSAPETRETALASTPILPDDPFTRAEKLLIPPPAPEPGPIAAGPGHEVCARPARSKLLRYLFEQRGRVLAAIAGADLATVSATALLDLESEDEKLLALMRSRRVPHCTTPSRIVVEGLREAVRCTASLLQADLAEALKAGESREQLSARVRAFYNDSPKTYDQ